MTCRRIAFTLAVLVVSLAAVPATPAFAQYFGRNKVQYKDFKFEVLKTEHFDIYFYPEEREGIDYAARMSERWLARLERIFEHRLRGRQPIVLYASHPDFEQTTVIPGELGEGTGGVTEPLRRRIVLPLAGPLGDTDHVIGHELVHAFQFDITTTPGSPSGMNGAERLPLWFIEGMAEYLSIGPVDPNTAMWLRDAARQEKLPSIDDLNNPRYFPYRWGQAFWAYVGGTYGDTVIRRMLAIAAAAGDVEVAFKQVLGVSSKQLSDAWHASIRDAYGSVLASATPPGELGTPIIRTEGLGGELNVGPAISPDGRRLAFLSERSVFSIDLFLADAANGRILRKLTSTATDTHYSSIQFIYSAGAWDRTSRRIAIAIVAGAHPAIAVFDGETGRKEQEFPIETLDEIFNPTWAPDGHAIAFTGQSRGLTDLYVLDVNTRKVQRLTNDAFAELQPAWSPDGRTIAFATDRFTTRLDTLDLGPLRIGLVDVASGAIRPAKGFDTGKAINPQWSPDGTALYFISDRDGIPNLYRLAMPDGAITQVTTAATGLSGITATSPALSIAGQTGAAAFSVYGDNKYTINILAADRLAGRPPAPSDASAGALPPLKRRPSEVTAAFRAPTFGLPPAQTYEARAYKPSLALDAVGQPMIAVGASRFGAAIGGGIALSFSDMLNEHTLVTAAQVNSGFTGSFSASYVAGQVGYFNQAHRWNWGVIAGQVPYYSGGFQTGVAAIQGQPAEIDQTIIFRQTERSATFLVAYPFNRAERVELQGGVSQIAFDQIVQTTAFSLTTGQLLINQTDTTPLANSLTLGTASAAFVHDTSNFGATSPVQGQRYRIEASPTVGSIDFTGVLADYRRYFMPKSFYTIAGRVLHYGRYGSGGDDPRLFPLYLGYPDFVRGYNIASFDASDCIPSATSTCPLFDRLMGSRLLVANLEFRFPLLRPFGATSNMYGPVPIEVAFFTDGGLAWNNVSSRTGLSTIIGSTVAPHPFSWNDGVSSAGVAFRVNLFGFAVGEFDFAKPFQRPSRGWVFEFNLLPGF